MVLCLFQFVQKILAIIANINSSTDVQALGRAGFLLLCKIANTDSLHIEPEKKINEAHQLHMKERNTEFCKGYIYKWTKDEEFANKSFSEILGNFTEHQRTIYQKLADSIEKVNSAVQTAYECNWKQIKMIKTVYSILQEVMAKNFPQL